MPPVGFEPKTPTGERPQTYTLVCTASGTGIIPLSDLQVVYAAGLQLPDSCAFVKDTIGEALFHVTVGSTQLFRLLLYSLQNKIF
jgi:hypothetical protein